MINTQTSYCPICERETTFQKKLKMENLGCTGCFNIFLIFITGGWWLIPLGIYVAVKIATATERCVACETSLSEAKQAERLLRESEGQHREPGGMSNWITKSEKKDSPGHSGWVTKTESQQTSGDSVTASRRSITTTSVRTSERNVSSPLESFFDDADDQAKSGDPYTRVAESHSASSYELSSEELKQTQPPSKASPPRYPLARTDPKKSAALGRLRDDLKQLLHQQKSEPPAHDDLPTSQRHAPQYDAKPARSDGESKLWSAPSSALSGGSGKKPGVTAASEAKAADGSFQWGDFTYQVLETRDNEGATELMRLGKISDPLIALQLRVENSSQQSATVPHVRLLVNGSEEIEVSSKGLFIRDHMPHYLRLAKVESWEGWVLFHPVPENATAELLIPKEPDSLELLKVQLG
jgi:hypothetical protein